MSNIWDDNDSRPTVDNTADLDDIAKEVGQEGVRGGTFKPAAVGDMVKGEVVGAMRRQSTTYGTDEPEFYHDGKPVWQFVVTIQTELRNWEKCNPMKDQDGKEMPPSEDTGLRAVWLKHSNYREAVRLCVKELSDAGVKPSFENMVGGMFAAKLSEEVPTKKGNPFKKFTVAFKAPEKKAEDGMGDMLSDGDAKPSTNGTGKVYAADDEPPF